MLKYEVKLGYDNLKRDTLVWSEKFVAPDLSFVSGVTSQDYHIDKNKTIAASIGGDTNFASLDIECKNVTRNGYAIILNKQYEIKTGKTTTDQKEFKYIYVNGVYYYITGNTVTVHNHLKEQWEKVAGEYKVKIVEGDVEGTVDNDNNIVKLDTIVWIEDDMVTIDGNEYIYDKYEEGLKYYPGGRTLYTRYDEENKLYEITPCDDISYNYFEKESEYIYVTKFVLTKKEDKELEFERLSYCTYFYYVLYSGYYCPVRRTNVESEEEGGESSFKYVCEVPKRLLPGEDLNSDEVEEFDVTYMDGELVAVSRISQLKSTDAVVTINETKFPVEYLLQNSNYGDELAVYLTDGSNNISVGDTIVLTYNVDDMYDVPVYNLTEEEEETDEEEGTEDESTEEDTPSEETNKLMLERYGYVVLKKEEETDEEEEEGDDSSEGGDDAPSEEVKTEEFVIFKNVKYYLEDDIADTVTINGVEYDVYYPNGFKKGVDALVDIDGDMIPMKIIDPSDDTETTPEETEGGESSTSPEPLNSSDTVGKIRYAINKYEGIRINGKVYRVYVDSEDSSKHIQMSEPTPYEFIVDSIEGSSLLICTPSFNSQEFTDEFIDSICAQICDFFVERQDTVKIISENRAFGTRVIDSNIAYSIMDNPVSSNDYYDAANTLTLFVNSGYIQIPLPLTMNVALNGMQEDIVNKDFYEVEKEKAINPIVDMEKDVYIPKYIKAPKYTGSATDFSPINQIEVNLHFRTRNMDNWKVNDGNNDISVSGTTDNWFCTDFFPYSGMTSASTSADTLMNTSDLIGLLYFTNDDVFYQRDKIAKSFLRFSYYDSPDPNTQSLLATSTVFMNEYTLYKKYVDNSRRNKNIFAIVTDEPGLVNDIPYGDVINRISVTTEYLNKYDKSTKSKLREGYTYKDFSDVKILNDKKDTVVKMFATDDIRLSSRFIIDNKYATDTSAEGFYLYIFREYSENLHPKPIYMKIEFNHAGVGRTIPFIVPMHWNGGVENTNEMTPERRLMLHGDDLDEMKKGYPLSFVYAQTYIPLYAAYDFKNKEYAYVFDNRYVTIDKDNKLKLNLFELKVATEDVATDQDRADVRNNNIARAVIDVDEQFTK